MHVRKFIVAIALPLAVGAGLAGSATASALPTDTAPNVTHADPIARYTATVKCQLVKHGGEAQGYITGTGSGKTKPDAVAAAKKDADRSVPQGYYKRHCKEI
ncbi:hypothetical protein IRT45_25245 [Nocardia sp. BSTN01]|uniref:hypothetical protein n=1 Tax=Nocardia sp. BSTN01 TaxID=2783665 RepID=UPI00188F9DDB|nr:hypothetical protein [Nocardia sp. BSTN01]MBF5000452.1 hypothetical protein [Nocardia sp. BSTN01]